MTDPKIVCSQDFWSGGQQKPRLGQKISGPQHFKSPPLSTTFLVKNFPDNNIIIAFVALFPISVLSMLRHEVFSMLRHEIINLLPSGT
jgi:hypothetical protein